MTPGGPPLGRIDGLTGWEGDLPLYGFRGFSGHIAYPWGVSVDTLNRRERSDG